MSFTPDRRRFLSRLAAGSAAVAAGSLLDLAAPRSGIAQSSIGAERPDKWLDEITGKHRQFFDAVTINDGFALGHALTFLNVNNDAYKVPDGYLTAIVGLRDRAVPLALTDDIWAKYEIGAFLGLTDPATSHPLARNMYYESVEAELPLAGMSIDDLQARGVIFTVCTVGLTTLATLTARRVGLSAEVARKEWMAGLIPGVHRVAAGVIAANRAQEKGCGYCFAG